MGKKSDIIRVIYCMDYENLYQEIMQIYGYYIIMAGVLAFLIFGIVFVFIVSALHKRYEKIENDERDENDDDETANV